MPSTVCAVNKCYNKGIYRFPTDEISKRRWLSVLNCPSDYLTNGAKICSKHFLDSDHNKEGSSNGLLLEKRMLKKNAVPSVFPAGVVGIKKCVQNNKSHRTNIKKIQHILSTRKGSKKTVHEDVTCNNCKEEIKGYRYKCVQCPDYDLCSFCEISKIHSDHVVVRLPKPLPYMLLQNVLTPLRDIFMINKNEGNTTEHMEILTDNHQVNRDTTTNQKQENESDDYPVEFLEDSFDSSEWEPTVPLESSAQPALKIKSMEIFKVGPEYDLPQDDNVNFNLSQIPLKIYSSKLKSHNTNESTSDGSQTNDQVLTNEVDESQNQFFKVEVMDEGTEILEEEYLEEDVKFCDFDSE